MSQGNAALSVVGDEVAGTQADSLALRGLVLLAQFHGIAADAEQLAHECAADDGQVDDTTLVLLARRLGLKAKLTTPPAERLAMANLPALALGSDGDAFIISRINSDEATSAFHRAGRGAMPRPFCMACAPRSCAMDTGWPAGCSAPPAPQYWSRPGRSATGAGEPSKVV